MSKRSVSAPIEAQIPDGTVCRVTKLLTIPEKRKDGHVNWKLNHTNDVEQNYFVVGLSLAPADSSGYEVCASRSEGCTNGCLAKSGFGFFFPNIERARIAKTILLFEQRKIFLSKLFHEIHRARAKASAYGKRLAVRLNVFSDLVWEKMVPRIFSTFPDVQFYDYTKHHRRYLRYWAGRLPSNYYLTFSWSGENERECHDVLRRGGNVAVPFDGELPRTWNRFRVINGDASDLRFKDPENVVVGLRVKGYLGKRDETGFVVRLTPEEKIRNAKRSPLTLLAS